MKLFCHMQPYIHIPHALENIKVQIFLEINFTHTLTFPSITKKHTWMDRKSIGEKRDTVRLVDTFLAT